jgi:hypothetical protein
MGNAKGRGAGMAEAGIWDKCSGQGGRGWFSFLLGIKRMHLQQRTRLFKICGASLAYVPMLVLLLAKVLGVPVSQAAVTGCAIFNFPAFSLLALIQSYHVSHSVMALSAIVLMFAWSSFIAWFFWRAVGTFQGDDEPVDQRGRYDWVGFRVRFFIGFLVGFLVGWRFVSSSTSMKTLFIASIVTGIVGGLIYGLSRPPDFWTRT